MNWVIRTATWVLLPSLLLALAGAGVLVALVLRRRRRSSRLGEAIRLVAREARQAVDQASNAFLVEAKLLFECVMNIEQAQL